jgi:hypothetical protein
MESAFPRLAILWGTKKMGGTKKNQTMITVSPTELYKKVFKISLLFDIVERLMTSLTKTITMMGGRKTLFPINSYILFPISIFLYIYTLTVYPLIIPLLFFPFFIRKKSNNKSKLINRQFFGSVFFGGLSLSPDGLIQSPDRLNHKIRWQACPVLTNFLSSATKPDQSQRSIGQACPILTIFLSKATKPVHYRPI